jgi:glycosyltransferase involved in cell wall biosynthesis
VTAPDRILVVSGFFDTHRGGVEIVAGRLARELAARRFHVTWLATNATPAPRCEPDPKVETVALPAWNASERRLGVPYPLLGAGGVRRLVREVRLADAVVLHDSLYLTSIAAFLAAKRLKKPLLIVQHIGDVPYRNAILRFLMSIANRGLTPILLANAQRVVFISEAVRAFFAPVRFRRPPLLIFNGVDTEVFRPARRGEKGQIRQRLGLPERSDVALFVGRFVEKKGLGLLKLVAALRPEIAWVFAGWGVVDPQEWGLANVRVMRNLSGAGLAQLYRASDVFVLPSQGEGFPLVIQEALASGLPVVCGAESARADAAAARFLVGLEVDGPDPAATASHLACAIDAAIRQAEPGFARQRHEFVQRRYAWSVAADQYAGALGELIAGRP